jgi:hypothetical protein
MKPQEGVLMDPSAQLESPERDFDDDWDDDDEELVGTDDEELELDEYDDIDEGADV